MIKLYASDLDGTLFNGSHTTDDFVVETIQKIHESGATFSIATGRDMHACRCLSLRLNELKGYIIAQNGALIMTMDRKVLYKNPLDKEIVRLLFKTFPNARFECTGFDTMYIRYDRDYYYNRLLKKGRYHVETMEDVLQKTSDCVFGLRDEEILEKEILKINLYLNSDEDASIYDQFLEEYKDIVSNVSSEHNLYEFTMVNVNKASAIRKLMEILDIEEHEVAVFGDGGNDVAMLEAFSNSDAPKEAMECAYKAAKFHLGSYKEHAVCKQIQSMLEAKE